MVSNNGIANFIKKTDFDDKLNNLNKKLHQKHILIENKFKKNSDIDQSYIGNNGSKNFLMFQRFLVFEIHLQNGNLKDCQIKILNFFLEQIIVFLPNWY